jgi:hypothetical protein
MRTVAGTTPVEKDFDFPKGSDRLWLEIEKRGYEPLHQEVTADTKNISAKLARMYDSKGDPVKEYYLPHIRRILVAAPEFEVIKRGFASEVLSQEESSKASQSLIEGAQAHFRGRFEVAPFNSSQEVAQLLKPVLRDARTAMELIDPVRLKYLPYPQFLETRNAREAARQLGSKFGGDALLLITGKQNVETAGMLLGKIGIFTAGTAASYAGAYANAVSNRDTWFIYTVYLPAFSQGTLIKAALIDCVSGEVLWVNKGIWGAVEFEDKEEMGKLAKDLFANL